MSKCFAYFRLPYSDSYTLIESERDAVNICDLHSLKDAKGYVIAPFSITTECPATVIYPDYVKHVKTESLSTESRDNTCRTVPDNDYEQTFLHFHKEICVGKFQKLVLARKKNVNSYKSPLEIFVTACQLYPRLMIQLFSTPQTGTWIIASPEILVEESNEVLHTVALAGTMKYAEGYASWSTKNQEEQHIVEQYINNTISPLSNEVVKDGPVSVRAGNLMHLRTDFHFRLKDTSDIGQLIHNLHPTPAVCGLPKIHAADFIRDNENIDRKYYSGFAGPLSVEGETHLYVSLRCAELDISSSPISAILYAGGGIMPESNCRSEWEETENKMQTILACL